MGQQKTLFFLRVNRKLCPLVFFVRIAWHFIRMHVRRLRNSHEFVWYLRAVRFLSLWYSSWFSVLLYCMLVVLWLSYQLSSICGAELLPLSCCRTPMAYDLLCRRHYVGSILHCSLLFSKLISENCKNISCHRKNALVPNLDYPCVFLCFLTLENDGMQGRIQRWVWKGSSLFLPLEISRSPS